MTLVSRTGQAPPQTPPAHPLSAQVVAHLQPQVPGSLHQHGDVTEIRAVLQPQVDLGVGIITPNSQYAFKGGVPSSYLLQL